jgi:transcriptional antiterminator NusG
MLWYVLRVKSGSEELVKIFLENKIEFESKGSYFNDILIPSEDVFGLVKGKKSKSVRKFFPGYILICMILDSFSWHFVCSVPMVSGFVRINFKEPFNVSQKEIDFLYEKLNFNHGKVIHLVEFNLGDKVLITSGPFNQFNGIVEGVKYDKNRVRVGVLIFGRSTPIDLKFGQVEKV